MQPRNQNSYFYQNRLESEHGLDSSCVGANRPGEDLSSPEIAITFELDTILSAFDAFLNSF